MRFLDRGDDLLKRGSADDHEVHVAEGPLRTFGCGPKNEGEGDLPRQRGKGIAQDIRHAGGFPHNARQLVEDDARAIRLIAHLVSEPPARHEAGLDEALQFPAGGSRRDTRQALDLPQVEVLARPKEQKREQAQVVIPEKKAGGRRPGAARLRTHDERKCTPIERKRPVRPRSRECGQSPFP